MFSAVGPKSRKIGIIQNMDHSEQAYIICGIATPLYIVRMSFILIPQVELPKLLIVLIVVVTLRSSLSAWAWRRSLGAALSGPLRPRCRPVLRRASPLTPHRL